MGITGSERVERLRREGVEQWVDGIRVSCLHTGIGLEAEPRAVVLIDVVIDARRLYLLVIIAGMRHTLAVGAAISIVGNCGSHAVCVERTSENRERRAAGISIK